MARIRRGLSLSTLLCLLLVWSCILAPAAAVQKSLAGVIDWNKQNVGIPRADIQPVLSGGQVVLVTRSDVVAALNEQNGTINWRIRLDSSRERISGIYVNEQDTLVVSEPSETGAHAVIRSLASATGHLQWETLVPLEFEFLPQYPMMIRWVFEADSGAERWLVVLNRQRVVSLNADDGNLQWEYDPQAPAALSEPFNGYITELAVTSSKVHLFGHVPRTFDGQEVNHLALDMKSGEPADHSYRWKSIGAVVELGGSQIVTTRNVTRDEVKLHYISPDRSLHTVTLGDDASMTKPERVRRGKAAGPATGQSPSSLQPLGLDSKGYFLALDDAGGADLVNARASVSEIMFNFDSDPRQQRSPPIWNGYVAPEGGAYVTRIFWSHSLGLANLHIYNIDHPDGFVYTGKTIPYQDAENGVILDSAVAIKSAKPIVDTFSAVLVTSTGAIQYWREDQLVWAREESLAEVKAIKMVELPEKKSEDAVQILRDDDGIAGRLIRQSKALSSLPAFIAHFVARFLGGTYTKTLSSTPLSSENLHRDAFGFQKLLVIATSSGKLFALDSAHGNIIWSRLLGTSACAHSTLDIRGIWPVRGIDTLETPVIAVVAVDSPTPPGSCPSSQGRGAPSTSDKTKTVAYHFDAFTGQELSSKPSSAVVKPAGREIFDGEPSRIFPLPVAHCKTHIRALAIASQRDTIHLFPFCKKIEAGFQNITSQLHFASESSHSSSPGLVGWTVANRITDGEFALMTTYRHPLSSDATIKSISRPSNSPIASFGRVLGDRSALYKYLNPHLAAIVSQRGADTSALLQVIDESSGRIIYAATIKDVDEHGLSVVLTENWLVYAWSQGGDPMDGSRGHRLVSLELFEMGKSKSSETSSFDGEQEIEVISKTFVTSSAVRSLGVTTSLQGITSKDLIYIDDRGQVNTVTRRLLDPRRPAGPPSKADREEMLIPYSPFLPADSRRVVSHEVELKGLDAIYSAPTLLESTGIILATGLDLFSTRVQPSGTFDILSDAFNKVQLILTILGLGIGIAVAGPAVSRKVLRARWY